MLDQQIREFLKLKIIDSKFKIKLRVEKSLMRELIRLVELERHENVIRVGNTLNLTPKLDFIFVRVVI